MKVEELLIMALESNNKGLVNRILEAVKRGLVRFHDDEFKFWKLSEYEGRSEIREEKDRVCFCIPREEEASELSGIIVNEELAKRTPCHKIRGTHLVFSKGVVGTLSEEQKGEYCKAGIIETDRPGA